MKLALLAAACVCAYAFPHEPTGPPTRNTIFADERFEGGLFENLDAMESFELSRNTDSSSRFRLPNTTRPYHYNILWQIQLTPTVRSMTGATSMEFYATQGNVNEIVLHAAQMNLTRVHLARGTISAPAVAVTINDYVMEEDTHFLRISLNESLVYNSTDPVYYTLSIEFFAPLRTDMYGIYESWYRNNPNNQNEAVRYVDFEFNSISLNYVLHIARSTCEYLRYVTERMYFVFQLDGLYSVPSNGSTLRIPLLRRTFL